MTTPAAAPAVPAAAPAAPAASAAPTNDSLLPADPGAAPPAEAAPAAAAPATPAAPTDPNSPEAWVLSEGVQGAGKRPEWFKADKYKSVADQAAAYPELEKRFGAFTGAPKEGKYDLALPEGAAVELVGDHPLLGEFQKWAGENQLSQTGFTALMGMLGQYEAQHMVDMAAVKTELGENADARITAIANWGKANLDKDGYETLRQAVSGVNGASVFKTVEALIGKTKQITLPGPKLGDIAPVGADAHAALDKRMQTERDEKGALRWNSDPKFRAEIEAERRKLYEAA